jgi:serine protease inhibitor
VNKFLDIEYDDKGVPKFIWFNSCQYMLTSYQIEVVERPYYYDSLALHTAIPREFDLTLRIAPYTPPPPPPKPRRTYTQAIGLRRPVAP